ncbi:hypothetical protein ASG29_11425 [Sphingomonas sp. Leaf412]|uniref:type II toxin-antitoxin system VapC family toxin n=1 Tax=Sphingomonas sp. Leaf412 TaxID=1736370 RepID=UPI0006F53070|nr:type II toxin-antitoxin system VapC family toxin [Sphingomonas sp. Leaf412]KQT32394.1 hypothetical protein ASG29_11425 [Sphingomonas sp. Leaf412]
MSAFILDASMALSWYFRDEFTDHTRAVSVLSDEQTVVVPQHWFAEIANGMLVGERRKRTTTGDSAAFAGRIALLNLEVDAIDPAAMFDRILPLARAHRLTVYDTLYLELAERRGLPLASLDDDLNNAARRVGIALVEEPA